MELMLIPRTLVDVVLKTKHFVTELYASGIATCSWTSVLKIWRKIDSKIKDNANKMKTPKLSFQEEIHLNTEISEFEQKALNQKK